MRLGSDPGRVLRWRIVRPAASGPHPVVLVAHGYTSHGDWGFYPELSRRLRAVGIASVRVSFSGSGLGEDRRTLAFPEVFARNTYVDELFELDRVRDEIGRDPTLDGECIGVLGHSRGGGMALVHAAENGGYRAVVGWAAMDSILRFSAERLQEWREQGAIEVRHWEARRTATLDVSVLHSAEAYAERLDPIRAAARLEAPALFVVGSRDRAVPVADGERLVAAARNGRLMVVDGDHVFDAKDPLEDVSQALDQVLGATVGFFDVELSGNSADPG